MKLSPDAVDLCDRQFELMLRARAENTGAAPAHHPPAIVYGEYEQSNALIFRHVRHVTAGATAAFPGRSTANTPQCAESRSALRTTGYR